MRFVHPEYLWFLLFALVPLVLYFLNLQKVVRVGFTKVDFLESLKKETNNRFQAKRLLITLARMLFVLFLVLAFASPTFQEFQDIKPTHHLVYLDNSLSMTRSVRNTQLLDQAKTTIESILPNNETDKYSLITNSDRRINRDFNTKKELLKELTAVEASGIQSAMAETVSLTRRKKTNLTKQLYLVSDFQESMFSPEVFNDLDTSIQTNLVQLESSNDNLYLDSLWVDGQYLSPGSRLNLQARLVNRYQKSREVLVKCYVDQKQVSSVVVPIAAQASQVFEVESQLTKNGLIDCKLVLEDEALSFDNTYYFELHSGKTIRVLVVSQSGQSYVSQALSNEELFALQSRKADDLNSSIIAEQDFLVIDQVTDLSLLPLNEIKRFIQNGGTAYVIPSSQSQNQAVARFLSSLGLSVQLLSTSNTRQVVDISKVIKHKMFRGVFENTPQKIEAPWYQPAFSTSNGESLIASPIGNDLLSAHRVGLGKVYLLNTPLTDQQTNFHKHALFVPTHYLLAKGSTSGNANLAFGMQDDTWPLKQVRPDPNSTYRLVSSRVSLVPQQNIQGTDLTLFSNDVSLNGHYAVRSSSQELTRIAVNYSPLESELNPLNLEPITQKNIQLVAVSDERPAVPTQSQSGFKLWKWFLLGALVWLLFETVLIRFFK